MKYPAHNDYYNMMNIQIFKDILINRKALQDSRLIKVCAWCPKEDYPVLFAGQEYTHGMCRKHYRKLSNRQELAFSLLFEEFIDSTITHFKAVKENKYLKRLKVTTRLTLHGNPFD